MDINTAIKQNLQTARQNLQTAKQSIEAARQEIIAARKCENINDPVDTYVMDYLAIGCSKVFIKLHIIPNVVTMLSMLTGVAGGILLMLPRLAPNIIGALLVILSAVFDCSDGQVARLTKHYSRLGRMLDGLSDATVYFTLYLACVVRLLPRDPLGNPVVWTLLLAALGLGTFLLYVTQSQLPDYFKNLHMYMIDNSHGNEFSRAKHVKAELDRAESAFQQFSLGCYYLYTRAQERRAPQTQRLLDAIEVHGKSDELCDAFYDTSRRLVKLTNLVTFNLRTAVLLIFVFLHLELAALGFVWLVLEPIRLILLHRYEALSKRLLPMVK